MHFKAQIEEQFKLAWADITGKVTLADLAGEKDLHKWWPTISHQPNLNWDILSENYLSLGHNPVAALIHVYTMGMVHALEGIDDESILPLQRVGNSPVPEWLTTEILEGIITKYGQNH